MKQSKRTRQFFSLFMRHQNRIFAYILTLVPHGADAEDIMQETASVAWEKFGTFKEGTDFAAWLKKIAFHKVMDHRKRSGHLYPRAVRIGVSVGGQAMMLPLVTCTRQRNCLKTYS